MLHRSNRKGLILACIALLISLCLTVGCYAEEKTLAPGVYEGSAQGFGGLVNVKITIGENGIEEVIVEGDSETAGVGSRAVEALPSVIIEKQSSDVDAITGATITSNAIVNAAKQCLDAANGIQASAAMKPGVYRAEVMGFNFLPVIVDVTVDENKILDIVVVEHDGNRGIGTEAVERLPGIILEAQSIGVDVITGATVTSNNILACVSDALVQAGADMARFSAPPPLGEKTEVTIDTDVLVIGGGMAGIAAAIEAAEAGAKVVLLEQQSIYGGTTVTCGGVLLGTGSILNKDLDNDPKSLGEYWFIKSKGVANYDKLIMIAEKSGEAVDWLYNMGVEFTPPSPTGDVPNPRAHWTTTGGTYSNGGVDFMRAIVKKMGEVGVEAYLDTKATELIQGEDGSIKGCLAKGKNTDYTINSKSVILATGGFDGNPELFAKYIPYSEYIVPYGASGNKGEGILMAEAVGAATSFSGFTGEMRAVDFRAPSHKSRVGRIVFANTPSITQDGMRFVNETVDYPHFSKAMETVMKATGKPKFFQLWDNDYTENYDIEFAVEQGFGYKADTLEELAQKAGIPAENLLATVEQYNQMALDGGVDKIFGTKGIKPIDNAPYFLTTIYRSNLATFGGIVTDMGAKVLKEDGEVIPGLYAVGECANSDLFGDIYPGSGVMITFCTVMGRIAGADAAAAAQK